MILDVIIPILNEEINLRKLIPYLQSVCEIKAENIIVVDCSKSKDDSRLFCKSQGLNYIKIKASCRSLQLNEGVKHTKAEAVLFLHADVIPPPNITIKIKEAIKMGYHFGFFSFNFDSPNVLLKINSFFTKFDGVFAGGGDQCHFFTRSCFKKLNGYKESFVIMEDFEIFRRIKENKVSYTIIDSPILVSDRKYQKNSYLKVNIINLLVFIKFRLNVCPKKLKQFYHTWLN